MRETRLFGTAFAAALASLLGLGAAAAADLDSRPQAYHARAETGAALPVWLVRYKLRQLGYRDIYRVSAATGGFSVFAYDRWGRHVKLFVDARTGDATAMEGHGLAHLSTHDVVRHLAALGYECLAPVAYRDEHYRVLARDADGVPRMLKVDPLSGAAWFERA